MEASASEQALSQLQRNRLDSGTAFRSPSLPFNRSGTLRKATRHNKSALLQDSKQFAHQSVNRKKSKASKRECGTTPHFTFHPSRFTVLSAALLLDQSMCKDTLSSPAHFEKDLPRKELHDAAKD